ncbi:YEATS-associated helix-containing protein [Hymenobacter cavernae]|uniref:YEATS-Like-Associating Three TM domain-containing protein n=1 Tax=Hymenobacter cavernae TaxID=2044852 RepID=A0ABQ1UG05_9BACT|nr:YEATS-associated helix-containing protein [Hymenobacter cavernae]GGF17159.1 hypothetical protein GCM10011383_30750 [Hymenobacter cavernae]
MAPNSFTFNWHPFLVFSIIVSTGFFGGIINYYYSFEGDNTVKNKERFIRCVLLSIGSSLLVPNFLQMISSPIIEKSLENSNLYLILIGFCLVFGIFSRRFITGIGDKILASVKKAEEKAEIAEEKAKKGVELAEEAKTENDSTKQQVKDLNVALSVSESNTELLQEPQEDAYEELINKANDFVRETTIGNYAIRLELKASLGREMGLIIINNNLDREFILSQSSSEGIYLAICYSVKLRPRIGDFTILDKISNKISQKFTKYQFCDSIDKLIFRKAMSSSEYVKARKIIEGFKISADQALLQKIEETTQLLNRRVHGVE